VLIWLSANTQTDYGPSAESDAGALVPDHGLKSDDRSSHKLIESLRGLGMRRKDALLVCAILATIDEADGDLVGDALDRIESVILNTDS
jgi:hypothetical protein